MNAIVSQSQNVPLKLSWNECHELVELLASPLRGRSIDTVVGISRSGLVPAVMLSHALGIRDFAVLDIARTKSDAHHSDKHSPVLRDVMNARLLSAKQVLLVDDIVGAGETLRVARDVLTSLGARPTTAALVFNRGNARCDPLPELDHYGCRVECWVEFPWECKDFEWKAVEHA